MKTSSIILKILMPLALGAAILYWMYRGEDWQQLRHVMVEETDWTWMLLSFPFGILAQMCRGWRWRQTLEPVINSRSEECGVRSEECGVRSEDTPATGESLLRTSVLVHSIFLSYAASLVIPRVGEFTRCGVLKRYDGVSFPKALGTVVAERAIDTLVVLAITAMVLLLEMSTFGTFFRETGTDLQSILHGFSWAGYFVAAVCAVAIVVLLHFLLRRLSIYNKVRATFSGIWQGVIATKDVRNIPLFVILTLGIWLSYFLHYYLTFFCFPFTAHLGIGCALVTFIVGSIAVIVPTPNGAGPWHFAVKTMLILYGVADVHALYFVLIVHTVQTMLVILLGVYAWVALNFTSRSEECGVRSEDSLK